MTPSLTRNSRETWLSMPEPLHYLRVHVQPHVLVLVLTVKATSDPLCFHPNLSSMLHPPQTENSDTFWHSKNKRSAPLMHMHLVPVAAKQVNHGGTEEGRTSLSSLNTPCPDQLVTSLRILNTVTQQGSDIELDKMCENIWNSTEDEPYGSSLVEFPEQTSLSGGKEWWRGWKKGQQSIKMKKSKFKPGAERDVKCKLTYLSWVLLIERLPDQKLWSTDAN